MLEPGRSAPSASDRRQDERSAVFDPVKLVASSGQVFDATVVDRSLRGLRIETMQAASLPPELTVLSRAMACVYKARVVWRTAPYAGLSISQGVDMRTASGSELDKVRKLWREHIGQ